MGGLARAALQVGETSILERLVQALRTSDVAQISAVIGPYREQLLPLLDLCQVQAIAHSRFEPSLIDCQRLALKSHQAPFPDRDLLLVLGDLALLTGADVSTLIAHWDQRDDHVHAQVPMVNGVRGHPVLLSCHAVARINAMPDHMVFATGCATMRTL
ncbi:CTP:molybdopterin cytidylyltransferase MocA [Polaromonas sp. CG_23.6]|nr:CTP:molybdopterin cytidylyltransferase MocA [Polaromonas sp. CG_23.6]